MNETPKPGEVWRYPYLWARQSLAGETEGRKKRPSAVAVLVQRQDGRHMVVFLAVTTQKPAANRLALEVPETECRRAGLTLDRRIWVILDEHNQDVVEHSFYLEPNARQGAFSARFCKQMQRGFAHAIRNRNSQTVRRVSE